MPRRANSDKPARGGRGSYYRRFKIVRGDKATHTINAEVSLPGEARIINYSGVVGKTDVRIGCP